ncbi:RBR-type E3 ubiquitin transferase [Heracleum sosnowskyi]|uniref:RBR-type E3 ubiquitin transferase n=1 Tax=Heracleum sosnowskyi TaxID=360622 RepID=A0AAD8GTI1_9APIA|nr:RBR-type E3 ubiquitin transferase [Heracleum sosnowskyi]
MNTTTSKSLQEIINVSDDFDDEVTILHSFSPSVLTNKGTDKNTAISVESYYMQQAIMASMNIKNANVVDLDEYPDFKYDVKIIKPSDMSRPSKGISVFEVGESSNSRKVSMNVEILDPDDDPNFDPDDDPIIAFFICEICVEDKMLDESFSIKGCCHSYCKDCVCKYVDSRVQENVTRITCPVSGCKGVLELEDCRAVLSREVFDRWGDALCQALILGSAKFYCPFKDCSLVLIMDDDVSGIVESECPFCRRLFCAQCKVPWHSGVECVEFQKLHKDEREREDIMLMQLAKNQKWIRCPRCKFYVERSEGCLFIKCRCGYTFCYNCGAHLIDHYCRNCKH